MKFTPASPKFTELLKNSLAFKFFVGAATGLFAKALSIILGAFLICGIEKLDRCYNAFTKFISLDQTLIESLTQSDLTSYDFISALILAPIIENIIFPLGFKVWAFLSKLAIFPVLTLQYCLIGLINLRGLGCLALSFSLSLGFYTQIV